MNKKHFWALMAALACTMWGISGLFAKALFNVSSTITPIWLSQVRMISSGIIFADCCWLFGAASASLPAQQKGCGNFSSLRSFGLAASAIILLRSLFSRLMLLWRLFCNSLAHSLCWPT
jgi:hypothetical protein